MITQAQKHSPLSIDLSFTPLPGSYKIYRSGKIFPEIRVPFREVRQSETVGINNSKIPNPSQFLYDTSGPYSDPAVKTDIRQGLPELRKTWILARTDAVELPVTSSDYRKQRETDPDLIGFRFPKIRRPLRAKSGKIVTQMHYARRGIVTSEMEFIAIREN